MNPPWTFPKIHPFLRPQKQFWVGRAKSCRFGTELLSCPIEVASPKMWALKNTDISTNWDNLSTPLTESSSKIYKTSLCNTCTLNSLYFNFCKEFYSSGFIYFFKAFPGLPLLVLGAGFLALGFATFLPPALFDLGAGFLEPSAVFLADIFLPADAPFTAVDATWSNRFGGIHQKTFNLPCPNFAFVEPSLELSMRPEATDLGEFIRRLSTYLAQTLLLRSLLWSFRCDLK